MPIEEEEKEIPTEDIQIEEKKIEEEILEQTTSTVENETIDNIKRIEKKYGEQWDFCTCVIKSDSVNTALMEASDEEFDLVMARSDYIDSKCKELLTQPHNTPEERNKHQQRVNQCLKNK